MIDPYSLPDDLPAPADDGAADHLPGTALPPIELARDHRRTPSRSRRSQAARSSTPTRGPGGRASPCWRRLGPDPGARGCTPESCGFRDHHAELLEAGADAVFGLSTQDTAYQRELAERLRLPYPILSDAGLELTRALGLPTFEVAGLTLLRRLTMVIGDGTIERVWYPVFPPDTHAAEVVAALRSGL